MSYYSAAAVPGFGMPKRVTKLLDENGILILEYVDINPFSGEAAQAHPAAVLADCEEIWGTN